MANASAYKRIVVHLDLCMSLEANILNQYERLPKRRRAEWLRRLLVQGYLAECQALPASPHRAARRSIPAVTRSEVTKPTISPSAARPAVAAPLPVPPDSGGKPFVGLAKVIG